MTLTMKIKIPPVRQRQPSPPPPPPRSPSVGKHMEQDDLSAKPQRNRKRPKRYQEASDTQEPERKIARTEKPRRMSTSEPLSDSEMTPALAEAELDVVNPANDQPEELDDRHSEPAPPKMSSSSKGQPKSTKAKGKAPAAPARKKRNVVVSDTEEEEDDYMDTTLDVDVVAEDEDDEDYYSLEEKPSKASKGGAKSSATKAAPQGTKRKAKAEPSDAGQSGVDKKSGSFVASSKKKAKLPPKAEEAMIDVVGDSPPDVSINVEHSSPATAAQDSPPVVIPKKQKLPTIKKTKLAASSGVSTPLSANPSTAKPPLELGLNNKLNHGEIRKTMINQTDIDLSNKSIYQEIFLKMAGDGGTPRRTKEEERRKELNRLRDEAKAKRLEESQHSFDLQAQYDKISRFEDKLRADRSSALWPNFLGAKWREEYERDKRRQKDQQWQEAVYDGREEGEVN